MVMRFIVASLLIPLLPASPVLAQATAPGLYDFAYRVSGDRRVAPVQVFDDGQSTFVQFKAGQTVPAIFRVGDDGEQLVPSTLRGGYVVLAGTAHEWIMRIGSVVSAAQYEGDARDGRGTTVARGNALVVADDTAWSSSSADSPGGSPGLISQGRGAAPLPAGTGPGGRSGSSDARGVRTAAAGGQAMPTRPAAVAAYAAHTAYATPAPVRSSVAFDASSADPTMRAVLSRWAKLAGWSFDPQHWTVDVDIPLAGTASFGADFKSAVRELLAATELSTRPLQPCFYSNQVLRVVPLAEACNRAATVASKR
ncbi:TrbG/VirB9 family P-type conjugative transfer protein [Pigmentiphaga litoralis]|uniref:TrbG/VirB9 family P-type conjugative transfer protein n=1 Tax=Pigmentiphaga litoralis TaxID=516702 RepID=UPI003B4294CA